MCMRKYALCLPVIVLVLVLTGCGSPRSGPTGGEFSGITRLSLEEARAAFDNGAAIFVDVRSADSYASGHIPGARSIPLGELEGRLEELDPAQWIITYCT